MLALNYLIWLFFPVWSLGRFVRANRNLFIVILVIASAALCVFQNEAINKDREEYRYIIQELVDGGVVLIEPAYVVLIQLLSWVTSGEYLTYWFFFLVALFSIWMKFRLFDEFGASLFGCFAAYFSYFFLLQEMTQIRVGLSIALLYFSWFSYFNGRYRRFFLYGIAATLCHFSGLVFVLGLFMFSAHGRKRWMCSSLILLILAFWSLIFGDWLVYFLGVMERLTGLEKLSIYLQFFERGMLTEISYVRLLPHFLLLIVYGLLWRRLNGDAITFFLLQIYSSGILVFIALSPFPVFAYRISDLFLFAGIFLVGRVWLFIHRRDFYAFSLAYTGVFIIYTLQFSGLFLQ